MIFKDLKEIINKINEKGKMNFFEGTSEEKIFEFEKENNVKLPSKYREWLLFSDGGELFLPAGVQLYGIEHKPIIDVNNNDRPSDKYIVIGALASGDTILCENDSEKISIYNLETGKIENDETYDNFIALLNDLYDLLGIECWCYMSYSKQL